MSLINYIMAARSKSGSSSNSESVQSVNGKTGVVELSASDVNADAKGTATSEISTHNSSDTAHDDIRQLVAAKIAITNIVNNLTTNSSSKVLSAAQGVALKKLIDAITIPTKVSELTNDSAYITNSALTDYAKKTEVPDVSTLETKVNALYNSETLTTGAKDVVGAINELNAKIAELLANSSS